MTYIILGVIVIIIGFIITAYNGFKTLDLQAKAALSNIDVALVKRYDTLTNMVEVVKGYSKHELDVFTEIAIIRSHTLKAINDTDNKQSETLNKIMGLMEAYPQLKADQNFLHLQHVIADVEEHLQASRRLYNQSVREYNTRLDVFPSNIIGKIMNLMSKEFYVSNVEQRENVEIKFQ